MFRCTSLYYDQKEKMIRLVFFFGVVAKIVSGAEFMIKVNYDIGHYKLLQVNQTLELICKNLHNRNPPSWTYHSRLYRDPRMKLTQDVGESRLVISNATAGDAGKYMCLIDYEHNDRTFHFNRTIEVIVNEIRDVKVEEEQDSIKLLCDVHAYPSAKIIWKIDYDKEEMKPQHDEPDQDDEYWMPPDDKVVVDKSEGRWTLRPYKGVNNAELIIADVTNNDNGNYSCVAKSIAGEQCKDCTVRVTREAEGAVSKIIDNTASHEEKNPGEQREGGVNLTAAVTCGIIAVIAINIALLCAIYWVKTHKRREEFDPGVADEENATPLNEIQPNQEKAGNKEDAPVAR